MTSVPRQMSFSSISVTLSTVWNTCSKPFFLAQILTMLLNSTRRFLHAHNQLERKQTEMLIASVRMTLPPEREDEMLRTMRLLLGPTRVKPGCIGCTLYREVENENAVVLVEEWESEHDLYKHIRSYEYRVILALMDMSKEPPEIRFRTVSDMAAMETIRSIRKGLTATPATKTTSK